MILSLPTLISLGTFASFVSAAPTVKKRADTCNGHSELCDRTFDNVTYVGAHDSFTDSSFLPSADQELSVPDLLSKGVRHLQAQAHKKTVDGATSASSNISLCHTSCILYDGGTLEDYLSKVKGWLDDNKNEVISMLFVNSDDVEPKVWDLAFKSSGMDSYSYSPDSSSVGQGKWPTLGDLIDSGKRSITFLDSGASFDDVPYLVDEFSNIWETPFDVTDKDFPCTVDRGDPPSGKMGLINHFLDKSIAGVLVPDKDALDTTNSADDVVKQAEACAADQGRYPTIMLLDFVDKGDPFSAADKLNGVA